MMNRFIRIFFLISLVLFSTVLFSQTIKSIKVLTADGSQVVLYDPSIKDNMGLNFVQLYKGEGDLAVKFEVEVYGENLPDNLVVKTNIDKGPEYIHNLIQKLNALAKNGGNLSNVIKDLLWILPKSSTDPFLLNKTENPELPVLLYRDIDAKKTSPSKGSVSVYHTDYLPIKREQTGNLIFQIKYNDGRVKTVPLYYESNVHNSNINVLNVVISPDEARSLKIQTVNPYQLGDMVDTKEDATKFKVVNRGKWKYLYSSNRNTANEQEVFEEEVFPVKSENTQKSGFLKLNRLDDPEMQSKILDITKSVNANTVWFMPINENSPLRMSPDLKNARVVKIGDRNYIVSLIAKHPVTRLELPHNGLFYQHETIGYSVSEYLGGNNAATSLIKYLNDAGFRVMLEEHPDKVSSLGLSYNSLSFEAETIIKNILLVAGYEVAPEDANMPFNILTTKLRNVNNGSEIYSYQFFALKYGYEGRDVDPNSPNYVSKENRVPLQDVNAMAGKISEIYVPVVGVPNNDWTTFAQLKMNNPYVELIELVARLDYYKQLFGEQNGRYLVGIREDAVHFGILRYDQRSQFVRYINELKQAFPGIIVAGEVIAQGAEIAWIGMPLDVIQPPTLIHRDNNHFADHYGRTNRGQIEWNSVIQKLREFNKVYFSSLTSYDTCPAVTVPPFDEYAMLERCELPYKNHFDAFTKEAFVCFAPTAINSMCAGEERGTLNDYKNFKADQFGYFQLPYEEGNFDQTRIDLLNMYPVLDKVKNFLQTKKYGYNYREYDARMLPDGHLSAEVYSSDKGIVITLRNNSTLEYPMGHNFGEQINNIIAERASRGENLYVVFDMFEFDYNNEPSSFYNPETDDKLLFEKYDIDKNTGKLSFRRNLKPYETIVLTTLQPQELVEVKSIYYFGGNPDQSDVVNNPIGPDKPITPTSRITTIVPAKQTEDEVLDKLSLRTGLVSDDISAQLDKLVDLWLVSEGDMTEQDIKLLFGETEGKPGLYKYLHDLVESGAEVPEDIKFFLILSGSLCYDSHILGFSNIGRDGVRLVGDTYVKLGMSSVSSINYIKEQVEPRIMIKTTRSTELFMKKFDAGFNAIKIIKK